MKTLKTVWYGNTPPTVKDRHGNDVPQPHAIFDKRVKVIPAGGEFPSGTKFDEGVLARMKADGLIKDEVPAELALKLEQEKSEAKSAPKGGDKKGADDK